jgi:hypothetical protein
MVNLLHSGYFIKIVAKVYFTFLNNRSISVNCQTFTVEKELAQSLFPKKPTAELPEK